MLKNILFFLFLFTFININCNYFLHFTDIHYDKSYKENTPNNCVIASKVGLKCCRSYDIGLKPYKKSSKWGDYNCDSPLLLVNNSFIWMKNNLPNIDFIVYTGDTSGHHDITQTVENNIKSSNEISKLIDNLYPTIPFYQVLGNHDTYPIDQTVPYIYPYIVKKITNYWTKWLNNTNNIKYGYYSQYIKNNLKIIGFNSIYYDSNNLFKVNKNSKEYITNYQWKWLEEEFKKSLINKDKIIFLNHIPIGSGEATPYYNTKLSLLLKKYNKIILTNLYGHTHHDQFYLVKNKNSYITYGLITPSLLPDKHFITFRLYIYDNNNIYDYIQYGCNLTKIIQTNVFDCDKIYKFSELYNETKININTLVNIYNKFKNNDTIFQKYYLNYKPGTTTNICNKDCKKNYLDEIEIII